jgi:hypothetical protein
VALHRELPATEHSADHISRAVLYVVLVPPAAAVAGATPCGSCLGNARLAEIVEGCTVLEKTERPLILYTVLQSDVGLDGS